MTFPLQRGDAVRVRGERWRVEHVAAHDACAVVEMAGVEPSNAGHTGRFILPFEPLHRLSSHQARPRIVRLPAWRHVVRTALADATPEWRSLRAAARADIVPLPYQLEPALAMTRGEGCRFLLADEVGLGKTIQAGLLAAELLARERDARVLIVTPAGLREQWRDELRDRFAIDASVVDAGALARAAADLPPGVNPWAIPRTAIASIDFLKRADVIRSLESLVWDLVAFDEAHALCGRSDRALAADLVAARARRVVIITATPHSGDEGAFERLCALGRLQANDRLLTFRRSRREAGIPQARVTRRLSISPTAEEARMHEALSAYAARVSRDAPAETAAAARLAMIVLARRASSSAASLARSIERRMALLGPAPEAAAAQLRLPLEEGQLLEDDEPLEELAAPGLTDAADEQGWLERTLALARSVSVESKIRALRRLLRRSGEPALVFTEYRDTLSHVIAALDLDAAILHGGLTAAERAREARRFTHGEARLLVATDAASEGLNLHRRCRLVINLDVPWTPVRLEQRIGRVDRLGQERRVHAITLVARDTHEEAVASALLARAARAERDAPFGAAGDAATRRDDARLEASRLATARGLAARGRPGWHTDGRPVLTLLRARTRASRGRPRLILALRLLFVDATGAIVWDTMKGLACGDAAPDDRRPASVRSWFARAVRQHSSALAAASSLVHDAELAALRRDIRAALAPLVERERAILERLSGRTARLAAPLLQQGLFDRRAVREAEAQRRVMAEAAACAETRIRALERESHPLAGDRSLIFVAAWLR